MDRKGRSIIFYRVVLPVCTGVNLGLGILMLVLLHPLNWLNWMELVTGVLCCVIAGSLAAAGASRSYWGSAMERQVSAWRRVVDTIFHWIEEAPVPVDSIHTLKRSLDEAIASE
ncbi:MAG TPA: hypothetical protein VFD49_15420 [Candidatus Dormibacteraeota bacterium]|nr:hypothetical protein [Candidatus Dormibacteraeota bacterium]